MNCQNCNTNIDYNYLTNCPQCGRELEKDNLPKLDPSLNSAKRSSWTYKLTNLVWVLSTAFAGMLGGAVVTYFSAGIIYLALRAPETRPGEHCSEGMAIGFLSILLGGFLGSVAGTTIAVKRPVLKSR